MAIVNWNTFATIVGQVSAYENYVTSLKFKISFLNSRTGDKMLVYDHGYGKKYRYHDSWGWVGSHYFLG